MTVWKEAAVTMTISLSFSANFIYDCIDCCDHIRKKFKLELGNVLRDGHVDII